MIRATVLAACCVLPAVLSATPLSPPVLVRNVVDGNAIDVVGVGKVRLLGIAAPPMNRRTGMSPPFALEARQRLAGLLTNRWVRLDYGGTPETRSAYVFLETGLFVNELLVREGLARVVERNGRTRLEELKRAQVDAQAARRGIWGEPANPSESYRLPSQKRAQSPRPRSK